VLIDSQRSSTGTPNSVLAVSLLDMSTRKPTNEAPIIANIRYACQNHAKKAITATFAAVATHLRLPADRSPVDMENLLNHPSEEPPDG
jgi:hypothetical protein